MRNCRQDFKILHREESHQVDLEALSGAEVDVLENPELSRCGG